MTEKTWERLADNVFGINGTKEIPVSTPPSPAASFGRSAANNIRCPLTYTAADMAPDTFRYQDHRPLYTNYKNKSKGYGAYLVWEISETRAALVFLFLQTPSGEYPLGPSQPDSSLSRVEKYAYDILHHDFESIKKIMQHGLETLAADKQGDADKLAKIRERIDNLTMKECTADIYLPKNCAPHVGERLYRPGYPFNIGFKNPLQEYDVPLTRYARQGLREIAKVEAERRKIRTLRAKMRAAAKVQETPAAHARPGKQQQAAKPPRATKTQKPHNTAKRKATPV